MVSSKNNKLLFPPPIKRLQRINSPTRLPTSSSLAIPLSSLPNAIISGLPQPNIPNILIRNTFPSFRWHQVIRNMLKMGLDARRTQLAVMAQLSQFLWVLFKVALELLALDEFLADFTSTGFLHGESGHGAEGVGHTVPESLNLVHFEVVGFHFVAELGLALNDLREDGFIVLCGGNGCGLVFAELGCWDDEGECHSGLACSSGTADAVGVRFGGSGQVEVKDTGDVLEVDTAGNTVILFFAGQFAALVVSFVLVLVTRLCLIIAIFLLGLLGLASTHNFLVIGGDDNIVDTLVELLHDVDPRVDGQL